MLALPGLRLSVLDTSPVVDGSTAREALRNTVDLARIVDDLGYYRYWVPEHHSMRGVASAAPAVLVGQLAAVTSNIRVGSGGVLLRNHAPLVIAEQFGTLEALHPGRIDLGIGRALGGTKLAADAVRSDEERSAKSFACQVSELVGFLRPEPGRKVRAIPAAGSSVPVWLLGSTDFSARVAGELGLAYAFAMHLNPGSLSSALQLYRESFRPSPGPTGTAEPQALVSVSVIAAETDDRAAWLSGPSKRKWLGRKLGQRLLLPSPQEAADFRYSDEQQRAIDEHFANVLIGSADTVVKGLRAIADSAQVGEVMVKTEVFDHADRRRCYELIAEATH